MNIGVPMSLMANLQKWEFKNSYIFSLETNFIFRKIQSRLVESTQTGLDSGFGFALWD